MEEETTLKQLPAPDLGDFPVKDQLWWPCYQSLFEDGQPITGVHFSSNTRSPDNVDLLDEHSWTPGTEQSPAESAAVFSPSVTSLSGTSTDPAHDGRASKRKAQNRAAQRAHRERQRLRIHGLYDKIEKLQERCKQLQARNQMFGAAFQRFFRDGVSLLAARDNSRTNELETDDRSFLEEIFAPASRK